MPAAVAQGARFVTVEGGEGAGKSSNMLFIRDLLAAGDDEVVLTREPGGTALGEALRELLLGHRGDGMAPDTELLLMFAARAEHMHRVILPALAAGKWVLCDRFTDASFAYQGGGRGLDRERIARLADWTQGTLRPALTLLFDIPVAQGFARIGKRAAAPDRFESEQSAFFERVRACYLERAAQEPERFRVIDATQPLTQVQTSIKEIIAAWLKTRS